MSGTAGDSQEGTQLSLIANYLDRLVRPIWEAGSAPVGGDGVGVLRSAAGGTWKVTCHRHLL